MLLLRETKSKEIKTISDYWKVYWKAFEDNYGDLELECMKKIQLCNKPINVVYHNFQSFVRDKIISIWSINKFN